MRRSESAQYRDDKQTKGDTGYDDRNTDGKGQTTIRPSQAKARLYATKARETKLQRKRDTRRKVILGGALINLADRDQPARSMMRRLIGSLSREQDRKMFDPSESLPSNNESENLNERTKTSSNGQPHESKEDARHA